MTPCVCLCVCVYDRLLQPLTHTITLFIQLTNNEQADWELFTLHICFTQGKIGLFLNGCTAAVCTTGVAGGDGGIVCVRPDVFRIVWPGPHPLLLERRMKTVKDAGLIDPAAPMRRQGR